MKIIQTINPNFGLLSHISVFPVSYGKYHQVCQSIEMGSDDFIMVSLECQFAGEPVQ